MLVYQGFVKMFRSSAKLCTGGLREIVASRATSYTVFSTKLSVNTFRLSTDSLLICKNRHILTFSSLQNTD